MCSPWHSYKYTNSYLENVHAKAHHGDKENTFLQETRTRKRTHSSERTHAGKRTHTSRTSKPNMMTRRTHLYTFMNTHELNTYLESVQAQQDCNGFRVKGLGTSSTSKQKPHRITMAIAYCHRRSPILPGCKRDLLQKEKRPTIEANET